MQNRRLEFATEGAYCTGILKHYGEICTVAFKGETLPMPKHVVDAAIRLNAEELEVEARRMGIWECTMPMEDFPLNRLVYSSQNKERMNGCDFSHGLPLTLSGLAVPRLHVAVESVSNFKKLDKWVDLRTVAQRVDCLAVSRVGSKCFSNYKKETLIFQRCELVKNPDFHDERPIEVNYAVHRNLYLGGVCIWTRAVCVQTPTSRKRPLPLCDDDGPETASESGDEGSEYEYESDIEEFEDETEEEIYDSEGDTESEAETEEEIYDDACVSEAETEEQGPFSLRHYIRARCASRIAALGRGRRARLRVKRMRAQLTEYVFVD